MYKSNQQRLKSYVSERRVEEANADEHQSRLYEQIAADLGQEVQATALAKMAKRVVNKFGDEIQKPSLQMQTTGKPYTATDYLRQSIGEGKLSQIFDMIKSMSTDGLSKKEKIIVSDIKNKERRKYLTEIFNDRITPILEKKHKEFTNNKSDALAASKSALDDILDNVETAFIDVIAGGDKSAVKNIVTKARERSETGMSDENELKTNPVITKKKKAGRPKNPAGSKLLEVGGKPTKQGELASQLGINI